MLQTQTPVARSPQYGKHPFRTPDDPALCGAWFEPASQRHALVLVGLAGTAHQSRCYELNPTWIETLTGAGFRVLLLDYRGHGESALAQPLRTVRLRDYVADVWRVLRAAGLTPAQAVLFGHSLGAGVALEVAAGVPEGEAPFAGVVALAGVAASRWRGLYLRQVPGYVVRHPKIYWRASKNPQAFFLDPPFARQLLFQASTPQTLVDRAIALTCPESGQVLTDLCFLQTRPLRAKRALFVAGAQDGGVPPDEVYRSARDYRALGGCRVNFRLLGGAPHNLMVDGPVEEAARILVQEAEACEEQP